MTKLEELRALLAAATPGKWLRGETLCSVTNEKGTILFTSTEADAKLIALSHNILPTLLEAMELLKELHDEYNFSNPKIDELLAKFE